MRDRVLPLHPTFQPLLFMGVAFAGGVYLGRFLGPTVSAPLLLALTLACGSFCAVVHWYLCRLERNAASDAAASERSVASVVFFAVLLVGYGVLGALSARVHAHHVAEHRLRRLLDTGVISPDDPVEVIGRLVSPSERAPLRAYLDVSVERITTRRQTHPASGRLRLMVMLSNEEAQREFDRLQEAGLGYGARLRILTRLNRPRSYRNPGVSDYGEYLEVRGYDLAGVVKSPLLITLLERNESLSFRTVVYDLREAAERRIDQLFSARTAGILKALLLGNRYFLDEETAERFRAGGTFHLLVISGAHIAAIAGAILWLISHYTRRWALRALPTIFLLWTYTVAVGGQAPVTRATVMMTVMLAAPFVFRQAQPVNTVGLAALLLLSHNPQELTSPSFQLTFLAVLSIVLLSLPLVGHLRAIGEWRPTVETPEPPSCPPAVRFLAETLFWDERRFQRDQQASPIRFRLDKADAARWLGRLPGVQPLVRFCVLSLLVSGVTQMALLPLMAIYFHRVVLAGIVLNVVIALFVTLIGSSAILALGLSVMDLPLAYLVGRVTDRLTDAMMRSFDFPLSFRGASFRVPEYSGPGVVIYVVYFATLVYWAVRLSRWQPVTFHPRQHAKEKAILPVGSRRSRRRLLPHLVAVAWVVSFLLIATYPVSHRYQKGWLRLHFLDVGHGDCTLLELPDGTIMLVDGGGEFRWEEIARKPRPGPSETITARGNTGEMEPDFTDDSRSVGEVAVSPALWSRGIKRIAYLVLTHADADHLDGLFAVVKNFGVGRVLIAQPPVADARVDRFMRVLDSRRIPVQVLGMGDRFQIAGVQFVVLWPPRQDAPPLRWSNDRSLVLRISYGRMSILLAGDIERAEEHALLETGFDLHSQVLKVPHHGSRTSSTEPFLTRVRPAWAIITAPERSPFHHPHPDVVQRYRARGVCLLQTGRDGMITFETDGQILHMRTHSQL
ncbi:MAG TPA: ComEC/Rec2 family competence protein [Blastocatellia bacterium]|nr:ComEC/Rec2 family competence protein [Blastocatellia bacterium]